MALTLDDKKMLVKVVAQYLVLAPKQQYDSYAVDNLLQRMLDDIMSVKGGNSEEVDEDESRKAALKALSKEEIKEARRPREEDNDEAGAEAEEAGEGKLETYTTIATAELTSLLCARARVVGSYVGEPGDKCTISFASNHDADGVVLLVEGSSNEGDIRNVCAVKRFADEIYVAEGDLEDYHWHIFAIDKFPRGWARSLPLGKVLEVEQ